MYIYTRQGNTSTIEAIFLYSRCGREASGTGHKAKSLIGAAVYKWCEFKSRLRKTKICQLKNLIPTLLD